MKINLKKRLISISQQKLITVFLVVMFLGFTLLKPEFASSYSITNILCTMALYGIASLGMTMVILTGGTDLSAGSVMALSGAIGAGLLGKGFSAANPVSLPFIVTVLIALICCGLIGYLNGIFITKLKIAPFVATLAMMLIARGFVYVVADSVVQGVSGSPITFMDEGYALLGQGKIGMIPIQFIIYIILFLCVYVFLKYSRTGRNIYAVGGNADTAKLAGIKTNKVVRLTYTLSGILIGISGLVLVGKLSSASTVAAQGYELDFITAVALGGTSIAGGHGSVVGTLLGTAFLAVLNNGLDIINMPSFYQYLIKGAILVVAVCADIFINSRTKKG